MGKFIFIELVLPWEMVVCHLAVEISSQPLGVVPCVGYVKKVEKVSSVRN
jgi:hypothetical protein